ncbi:MAG: aminotransferase class I/II-fold pyridoxal phosphate-dependent enzyme, partial [Chloroflexi bacterium]|nr:aminotransferase class I/II-fold pyridoxal phosphate-dependent enzyme [Chloroflexota bacterium]
METIDLRSDTVTHPTSKMREAMANAPVGDDVYGDDPTINELERLSAEMLGKEAALFVASGTQGNLISIFAQAARGDEIITADKCHIFLSEGGGPAALGGVSVYPLPVQDDGIIPVQAIENAIRGLSYLGSVSRWLSLELHAGGVCNRCHLPSPGRFPTPLS